MNEEMTDQTENQESMAETQNEQSDQMVETQAEQQDSTTEENLRILREKYKKEKREKEDLLRYYQAQQAQYAQQYPPEPQKEEDPEELLTRAQVNKELQKFKKEMDSYKQEVQYSTEQTALRQRYPDFDQVVTNENIEYLRDNYPEIATALYKSSDSYNTAASAYTLIKKLGIQKGVDPYASNKNLIDENMKKPKPTASMNPTNDALTRAAAYQGKYTSEDKKRAYQEMINIIRNKP